MKVHNYFGSGYSEIVYQRSLMIEFRLHEIAARNEVEEVVKYHGEIVGKRRIDIIVEDKVLVELKAISELDNECYNQVLNCLTVFQFDVGLLLNFGKSSLQYRRFARFSSKEEK